MDDDLKPVDAAPAPKKKGGALKLIVLLLLVLGAGGGGAWWFLSGGEAEAATEPPLESRGLVTFEPFLVNLADQGGNRFLKVTAQLVLTTPLEAAHVQETPVVLMHLRSAILELLTEQIASELVTANGKRKLMDAVKARATEALGPDQVIDVLFSEFVVQF
jgi:flagellar FliL protein